MAGPISADRVKQTSTTTGTGTLNLTSGASSTFQTFVAGVGDGNSCHFCIANQSADEWEVSIGTVASGSPDTLSRTTILASSNSGSAVSFSAGTKDVYLVAPAVYGLPILMMPTTFAVRYVKEDMLSSTVGNARGTGAVDLQMKRTSSANVASGLYSVISGGYNNKASYTNTTIGGGAGNAATNWNGTIAGGANNQAFGANAFIGGGTNNQANNNNCVVAGGVSNVANVKFGAIIGGLSNTASQGYCTVGGGYANNAGGSGYSGVFCGQHNQTNGSNCFVGGGDHNYAQGGFVTLAGGQRNTIVADYAAILGGARAYADKYGQQSQACGLFNNAGDAQTSIMVLRRSTGNATQTEMFLDNSSARMVLANDTTWAFYIIVVARRTDANDESAGYEFKGVIDRNGSAGTTALVGTVAATVFAEDSSGWDVAVDADSSNGSLRIQVTGEASKNIQWVAYVRTVETTG